MDGKAFGDGLKLMAAMIGGCSLVIGIVIGGVVTALIIKGM